MRALGTAALVWALASCAAPEPPLGSCEQLAYPLSPYLTRLFVIGVLDPSADAAGQAYGIDLDAMEGGPPGTCTAASDHVSPISGASGVDDALADLVRT